MTMTFDDEKVPFLENDVDLLPTYQSSSTKSSLDEPQFPCDQKIKNYRRIRSKRFLFSFLFLALLICWIGYRVFHSEWTIAFAKVIVSLTSMHDCHSKYDSKVTKIMKLPSNYLPIAGQQQDHKRLVIVGDVHGMRTSLEHLLDKVKFNQTQDHLILVGDLVAKGPDSEGVVDLAMELGATCVLGNHEDQVIQAWDDTQANSKLIDEMEQELTYSKLYDKTHLKLAHDLGEKRIKWMKTWPIILRVGSMGDMGEVLVVHAGLNPEKSLEKQDFHMVMNMRSINHGIYTSKHKGKAWTKTWNEHQRSLSKNERRTIIYGHDSKRGLQINSYYLGIDSGCFKHKKLTAAILKSDENTYSYDIVQVNCY